MKFFFKAEKPNLTTTSKEYTIFIENLKKTCAQLEHYLNFFISGLLIQDTEFLEKNHLNFIELKDNSLLIERLVELAKWKLCNGQLQFLLALRHLCRQTLKLIAKHESKHKIEEEVDFNCRAIVIRFTPNTYMHDYVTNKEKKLTSALHKIQSERGDKLSADEISLLRPPEDQSKEYQTLTSTVSTALNSPSSLMSLNGSGNHFDDNEMKGSADFNSNLHLTTLRSDVATLHVSDDLFDELLKKFFSPVYLGIDDFFSVPRGELPISVYTGIVCNSIVGIIINLILTNFEPYLNALSQTYRSQVFIVKFETFFEQDSVFVARKNKCCFGFSSNALATSPAMNLCIQFREKLKKIKVNSSAELFCMSLIGTCANELKNISDLASKLINYSDQVLSKEREIIGDLDFLERYKKIIVSLTENEKILSTYSAPKSMHEVYHR